jgi:hypothetical protein
MSEALTIKRSWRINKELETATGLKVAFWRKAIRLRWIPFSKPTDSVILILNEDLEAFLRRGRVEGGESGNPTTNQ